jgi:serine/threonine-protein kinase
VRAAQRRRRTPGWLIALLIVLIAAASVTAGVLAVHWFRSWSSHVPPVTNRSLPAAEVLLRDEHYRIGTVSRAYSESVPKGTVIRTDPGTGQRLPQGDQVDLTVSLGKERFSVPRTTGLTPTAARQALAGIPVRIAAGLRHSASTTVPSGQVMDTSPAAGTSVRRGTVVTLVVSSGRPIVAVPNVVAGTPADQATATIKKAGFAVVDVRAYSDTIAAGAVISVDPAQRARQGSTVTITVSRGPHLVAVPQIGSGDPIGTAQAALRAVGLVPQIDRSYDGGVLGRVINIDPGAGTQLPVGSTVTLTVV